MNECRGRRRNWAYSPFAWLAEGHEGILWTARFFFGMRTLKSWTVSDLNGSWEFWIRSSLVNTRLSESEPKKKSHRIIIEFYCIWAKRWQPGNIECNDGKATSLHSILAPVLCCTMLALNGWTPSQAGLSKTSGTSSVDNRWKIISIAPWVFPWYRSSNDSHDTVYWIAASRRRRHSLGFRYGCLTVKVLLARKSTRYNETVPGGAVGRVETGRFSSAA